MANKNIKLSELSVAIEKELAAYSDEVAEGIKKNIRKETRAAVRTLKATSPRKTGEYAGGWRYRVEYDGRDDLRVRIYNGKKPQITHLLEHGHAKRNGGRVDGIPHIAPAVKELEAKLDADIKVVVT